MIFLSSFFLCFVVNNLAAQDCSKAWMHYERRVQLSEATQKKYSLTIPIEKIQIDFLGAPVGLPFNYAIEQFSPYSDHVLLKEEEGLWLHKEAYEHLVKMRRASGLKLELNNSYRSYAEQDALYQKLGPTLAEKAGYSEHHLYTAVDLKRLTSQKLLWLLQNAFDFGWIPSYYFRIDNRIKPENWHWRYVGRLAAIKFRCAWEEEINYKILRLRKTK